MSKIDKRKLTKHIKDKFVIANETFSRDVVSDIKRKIDIEIGDSKEDKFFPQFKTKHWDNESNFSLRYKTDYTKGSVGAEGNKIKWIEEKQEVHFYDLDIDEDGGFEIEIKLNEKPDTNVFEFSLQTKGLDFFYQPELPEGERLNSRGELARPQNVIGSYAAYHKTKKGNYSKGKEYRTGKAFHIYRPHVVDADGKETWAKLDIKDGVLTVTVPKRFLNNAAYPVLVDPTFGYTSIGASTSFTGNDAYFATDTPASGGTVDSITLYADLFSGNTDVSAVLWDSSSGNIVTNGVMPSFNISDTTAQWFTRTYVTSPSITGSTAYDVGVIPSNGQTDFFYDTGAAGSGGVDLSNSYSTPQALDTKTSTTRKYSVYATYSTTSSIDQEGFAFGDDDGTESGHTLDTQDTNITEGLGTKTVRLALDTTGDYASAPFKLKYQKNGSGGYVDVPVGSGGTVTPGIESGDVTRSGSNTSSTTLAITMPAYADGDLIIANIGFWQNNNNNTDVTWAAGPNTETVTSIETGYGSSGNFDLPMIALGWFIADGSYAGGTWNITTNDATRHDSVIVKVPAGEFDETTPIGATGKDTTTSDDTSPTMPAFTAGSSDGSGTLVAFVSVDQDPISGTPSGWTDLVDHDQGRMSIVLSVRDASVTDSESISSASWTIAGDAWTTYGYVVRPSVTVNEVYVAPSSNVAAGGEATTARLTAPSGKSGDFTTGRRWDDENGTDSIDIASDFYTELEWIIATQSPAADSDYYDFRVYDDDTTLDTYTVTPRWTISTGGAGTNIQINIGDAWKTVDGMQINIGDSWKTVAGAQINIGDSWKTIF